MGTKEVRSPSPSLGHQGNQRGESHHRPHPLRSDTHHRCLENICSQSCCPRGGRQHSSGPKSIIRPGWAGARRSEPNAPQGLQRRAWNFPPVGRPAQPHPIGGARWRRCEDAEIDSGSDHRLKWEPTPGPPCRKEAEDAGDNHSLKPRTPCWGPPVTPTTPSSPNLPHPLSICWLLKTQREGCLAQQELSPKAAIPVSMATGVPTQTSKVGGQKTEEGWRICTSVLWLLKPTKNFSFVPPRKRPKTPGASFLISEHDMYLCFPKLLLLRGGSFGLGVDPHVPALDHDSYLEVLQSISIPESGLMYGLQTVISLLMTEAMKHKREWETLQNMQVHSLLRQLGDSE
ncbi:uncharacterized protein LOC103693540 [Rattus norvegicus]|uniref:uncharacterized protein LOC103693540 n=1 Tax=Rattus norvegicus TaxID=10116 RepID=UPI0019171E27|nr:uncharacterized protein LOC103693540 [Rattus norvegicus]